MQSFLCIFSPLEQRSLFCCKDQCQKPDAHTQSYYSKPVFTHTARKHFSKETDLSLKLAKDYYIQHRKIFFFFENNYKYHKIIPLMWFKHVFVSVISIHLILMSYLQMNLRLLEMRMLFSVTCVNCGVIGWFFRRLVGKALEYCQHLTMLFYFLTVKYP